jgi:D-amino-acid dehydrogenase
VTLEAEPRVVVIGGGVIGVSCAYFLMKRGARVTLCERKDIGQGASFGNAGAIAPGHGPMNKPGRIKQAFKSLFDPLSPLYVAPRLDAALARWLFDFRRYCTAAYVEECLETLGPLGHTTIKLYDELVEDEALDCHYRREGYYEVYRTERALAAARHEAAITERHGFPTETVSGDTLREREPALRTSVLGGVHYPQAATVNPNRFVQELADRSERRGVEIRRNTDVREVLVEKGCARGVRTADGEAINAGAVVIAAGVHSNALARKLGLNLPLQAAKGYHRDRVPQTGQTPALRQTCMLGEASVFCTPMDGFVRFAGTLEFSGINEQVRRPRLEQLTSAAGHYFEGMGPVEAVSEWCGLRPCLSDGLPALGPVPGCAGAFVATGHAMLGLTLGPVTGKLIAEYIVDGAPSLEVSALLPARFR